VTTPKRRGPRPGPRPAISPEGVALARQHNAEWDALTDEERAGRHAALAEAIRNGGPEKAEKT
jgi:hypothetical protein